MGGLLLPPFYGVGNVAAMGAAAFSPLSLSPALWLKADAGAYTDAGKTTLATDTDPVLVWADQSGNGRDVTQGTSSKRPVWRSSIQNGLAVLRLDGVDDFMDSPAFSCDQPYTVCMVARNYVNSFSGYYLDAQDTANRRIVQVGGSATTIRMYTGTIFDSTVTTINAFRSIIAVFNGASSILSWDAAETTGDVGSGNGGGIRIGAQGGGTPGSYAQIDVGELFIVPRALNVTERGQVQTYQKARWGTA
jgi:hypothetical protein